MIRLVQIDYFVQGRYDHVAFIDTVTDTFVMIGREVFWDSWDELSESCRCDHTSPEFILRLKAVCPMWFMEYKG